MLVYVLRRLMIAVPVMVAISLGAFLLMNAMPGDPVDRWLASGGNTLKSSPAALQSEKQRIRSQLGLDLPLFYVSLASWAHPDTLYKVTNAKKRIWMGRLLENSGNWAAVERFGHAAWAYAEGVQHSEQGEYLKKRLSRIVQISDLSEMRQHLDSLYGKASNGCLLSTDLCAHQVIFLEAFDNLASGSQWKTWIPWVHFHRENRYHRWLFGDGNWWTGKGGTHSKGLLRGDWGWSIRTREPVGSRLMGRIGWSVFFTLLGIVLALAISLPLGAWMARKANRSFDRWTGALVLLLYSIPVFVAAVALLMLFANPDYFSWFPVAFFDSDRLPPQASTWDKLLALLPHLVLPLVTYIYGAFAFLSRTIRIAVIEVLPANFIQTARAKGLSEPRILFRHALRNALLPVVTILAHVLPAALGGSVLIESIFSIPGMGREMVMAVGYRDYPVVIAIVTLSGLFSIIGYLLADLTYAWADPRIRLSKTSA